MKNYFSLILFVCGIHLVNAQELKIKINHQYQDQRMMLDSNYLDHHGTVFIIERMQYYISGFVLKFNDGSTINIDDQYILASSNISNYEFFNADSISNLSELDSIGFSLGVDEEANHSDPNGFLLDMH